MTNEQVFPVEVEYDLNYGGGNYADVGSFITISMQYNWTEEDLYNKLAKKGIHRSNVIHFTLDEEEDL